MLAITHQSVALSVFTSSHFHCFFQKFFLGIEEFPVVPCIYRESTWSNSINFKRWVFFSPFSSHLTSQVLKTVSLSLSVVCDSLTSRKNSSPFFHVTWIPICLHFFTSTSMSAVVTLQKGNKKKYNKVK